MVLLDQRKGIFVVVFRTFDIIDQVKANTDWEALVQFILYIITP
jgi:hypothetical protein